ncbi:hypothetical protein BISA_0480 [Bifidobacterium saguini DSM 23967]|uniref:Uncharacterized protein n=2 Tax=Bifidobacterium saguini TaxID=762210 RepID=A0A087DB88_9BIFI|nr:hypothetical protein [Bifidobacterium saguini]KFI92788.1 hypothetical protein BISA_0480 [Bifidobacterium saguini DSM 23967]QTB91790.1 hypothetical protein BSD967_05145 [Bifidobacterium saguini]
MAAKKPVKVNAGKGGGVAAKLGAAAVTAIVSAVANPEMWASFLNWLRDQHFSEKLIELISKMHLTKDPLEKISLQCEGVEELIASRSAELSDDAPIESWRAELAKIRRGVEMLEKSPDKDRKKIKSLQQRSKKLWDSAFQAAAE